MSSVLYQKYRAKDFDELIGQEHITRILKNAVKEKQLSHAYLFVGSRGTGKTSAARILAKSVNCLKPKKTGNPCNKCSICESISSGKFLDLIEIDAASNRGIDQIRELKEKIEFSPSEGEYKVYIIDEVHMLTSEAFNALLKTLEEPPKHVIFILATTEVHKLPATILSRCQRYDFKLGTDEEIAKVIERGAKGEGMKIDKGAKSLLIKNARGSYRDALSLLDVIFSGQAGKDKIITEMEVREILGLPDVEMVDLLLTKLAKSEGRDALDVIDSIEEKGVNLQQFVSYTLEILREALVAKIKGENLEYGFFAELNQKDILKYVKSFLEIERALKNSSNQSLILEMIIPEFCTFELKKETESEEEEEEEEEEEGSTCCHDIDFEDIEKNWGKLVKTVKPINKHLYAFLDSSKPTQFEKGKLYIEVPFQFYKDQIECPQTKEILFVAIKETFGIRCSLVCDVNEKSKPRMKSNVDIVLSKISPKKPQKESNIDTDMSSNIEAIFEGM